MNADLLIIKTQRMFALRREIVQAEFKLKTLLETKVKTFKDLETNCIACELLAANIYLLKMEFDTHT